MLSIKIRGDNHHMMSFKLFKTANKATAATSQEIILVLGGPGSGKSTQCNLLEQHKGYYHISSGDLVRNYVKEITHVNTESAMKIRETMRNGDLVDDQMVNDLVKMEMDAHPEAKGFLIDGCPRTLGQLISFESQIGRCDKVLFFDVSDDVMKKHLLHRASVEHREDDTEVSINHRIEVFKQTTMPMIDYLKRMKGDNFICVNISENTEETNVAIEALLEGKQGRKLVA